MKEITRKEWRIIIFTTNLSLSNHYYFQNKFCTFLCIQIVILEDIWHTTSEINILVVIYQFINKCELERYIYCLVYVRVFCVAFFSVLVSSMDSFLYGWKEQFYFDWFSTYCINSYLPSYNYNYALVRANWLGRGQSGVWWCEWQVLCVWVYTMLANSTINCWGSYKLDYYCFSDIWKCIPS